MDDRTTVKNLGAVIGFGNMMHLASGLWGEHLHKSMGTDSGTFLVGPCKGGTRPCHCQEINDVVMCDLCNCCGWLTKAVYELTKKKKGKK